MKRSKAYAAATAKIDGNKLYSPVEAVEVAKATSIAKFDETVDVSMRLGVDPRKADRWSAARSTCPTAPARPPG